MKSMIAIGIAPLVLAFGCSLAVAATPPGGAGQSSVNAAGLETPHVGYRETGSAQDWVGIYSPNRGLGQKTSVCAVYSRPKSSSVFLDKKPVQIMRGELAAFVSWNANAPTDTTGETSFMMGTALAQGDNSIDNLSVDGKVSFPLVAVGDRLYVKPGNDAAVIRALRRGMQMVVTAQTPDNHIIKDDYSLLGLQKATDISKTGCK